MKKNMIAYVLATCLVVSSGTSVASAHSHEVQDTDHHGEATITLAPGLSMEQLQKILDILKQVVALMIERNKLLTETHPAPQAPVEHVMDPSMDEHHDESADTNSEPKFIIEVETHGDKTHVHARYLDKPEDMFFVDALLHDEVTLIADIKAHTGLSEDVIKAALKYFE